VLTKGYSVTIFGTILQNFRNQFTKKTTTQMLFFRCRSYPRIVSASMAAEPTSGTAVEYCTYSIGSEWRTLQLNEQQCWYTRYCQLVNPSTCVRSILLMKYYYRNAVPVPLHLWCI